jgi:hypothetical protein
MKSETEEFPECFQPIFRLLGFALSGFRVFHAAWSFPFIRGSPLADSISAKSAAAACC